MNGQVVGHKEAVMVLEVEILLLNQTETDKMSSHICFTLALVTAVRRANSSGIERCF